MLSDTPVTITICLGPLAVETRPTTSAGNRLCSSRAWLSSLIFHSSFMSLALAVVIMRSSRCQAVRCESPPSVNQSAGLPSDWLTDDGDSQRTAWQRDERIITTANARDMKLLWKIKLDNQPRELHNLLPALVVGRVNTASGPKQIVIVTGVSDNIYAIDA